MAKNNHHFEIKRFTTPRDKNQYLLISRNEAAALFSGSTFLKRGYGKIWGPKSMSLMLFSLKRLSYNLPSKTKIYPGSGELTEMGNEGWIQCLRSV
jgi:glyoxylase-like metal-dependent hydrolase (beta-lactamase superfamily II)